MDYSNEQGRNHDLPPWQIFCWRRTSSPKRDCFATAFTCSPGSLVSTKSSSIVSGILGPRGSDTRHWCILFGPPNSKSPSMRIICWGLRCIYVNFSTAWSSRLYSSFSLSGTEFLAAIENCGVLHETTVHFGIAQGIALHAQEIIICMDVIEWNKPSWLDKCHPITCFLVTQSSELKKRHVYT